MIQRNVHIAAVTLLFVVPAIQAGSEITWPIAAKAIKTARLNYNKKAVRINGTMHVTIRDLAAKIISTSTAHIKQRKDSSLWWERRDGEADEGEFQNPKYGFTLIRKNSNAPWVATFIGKTLPPGRTHLAEGMAWFNDIPYTFGVSSQAQHNSPVDEGMTIKEFVPTETNGIYRANFVFQPPPKLKARLIQSGTVDFDSLHAWVIRKFSLEGKAGNSEYHDETELLYDDGDPTFPILKHAITRRRFPKEKRGFDNESQYDLALADMPPSEFTLSAYGLPEPVTETPPPPSWFRRNGFWLGGGMVLALVGGFVFRRLRQRHESAT